MKAQGSDHEKGFRKANEDSMKWYLSEKEKLDSQEVTLHKPGEGLVMDPKQEP
eukprot:CAMPEP_0170561856 /NCGR_PEP_ID=MMETSP0211-20121228/57381_1 /TAXON_ID=311385 /ORGANISM="Pseudokeronopsis sp., Strain OXSARD2" /LENGTH=52 /DNA_ID=CAMNT_0010877943 /DNA_START=301 /DNA_END=455 /DNA_ORIENTATION=+